MARQKSEIELELQIAEKIARSIVRLKHSINADRELNEILPKITERFNAGLESGELRVLEVPDGLSLELNEVLEGLA